MVYLSGSVAAADLALMRRIDALHLEYPFAGSRMLQGLLKAEDLEAGAGARDFPLSAAQAAGFSDTRLS